MATLTGSTLVRRLHDRLGFGPPASLDERTDDPAAARALLLEPSGSDAGVAATPVPTFEAPEGGRKSKRATGSGTGQEQSDEQDKDEARKQRRALRRDERDQLLRWYLRRLVRCEQPVAERMAWFWHGHFATSLRKVNSAALMLGQYETMREHGRGSFTDLARRMVVDPAMLIWLDGNDNTVRAPNENLSREFMELFALGHGAYSEVDVLQGARALTGWRIVRRTGRAELVTAQHDDLDKTMFGRTANLAADGFVDTVLSQPAHPAFLVGRLWRRLVGDQPPAASTVETLVHAYGPDRDLGALLAAIAADPAFAAEEATLVKQPVEWLVGVLRVLAAPEQLTDKLLSTCLKALRGLGQVPFSPPDVGGWPAGRFWLTTASASTRLQLMRTLSGALHVEGRLTTRSASDRVEEVGQLLGVDRWLPASLTSLREVAGRPAELVAMAACSPEYVVSR